LEIVWKVSENAQQTYKKNAQHKNAVYLPHTMSKYQSIRCTMATKVSEKSKLAGIFLVKDFSKSSLVES
jgi:hypothetical protein